jgi:protein subunit release factor B
MSLNYNGVVVENKARYVNEQGGSKLTYNFVTDPRLKRGHNFGIIYVTSSNYDENTGTGTSQQRKNIQSDKNRIRNFRGKNYLIQSKEKEEQDKKRNDKEGECGVCTTKVTTTVRPTPITFEEMVQTDPLPPPPQPVLIWPKKTGKDVECQIEDGDLFDFDEEVKPLIHVIVSKTLEDATREVLEEEELKTIIEQQEKYKNLNQENSNRVKKLEEDERERFEEHNRKKDLKDNRIKLTKLFQKNCNRE